MKSFALPAMLAALPLAVSQNATGLVVGKRVCVQGNVMDEFCINRGTLLDNPRVNTLEEPFLHSVHCLIDVGSCVNSPYYVLLDPKEEGGLFAASVILTENAKQQAITLGKAVGICDDCDGTGDLRLGLRVAFDATVVTVGDDSQPTMVDATQVMMSNNVDDPCMEFYGLEDLNTLGVLTPPPEPFNLRARHLAHASLMMIGWGFLLPSGAIIAKFLKHRPDGLWFRIHRPLQIFGLICTLTGWIIALKNFQVFADKGYNNYRHGVMGMTVMIAGLMQPLNAFVRPHPPEAGEEKSTGRLLWEILHKGMGWGTILLAVCTISLGTTILPQLDDQKIFQMAYGIGCGGGLLLLIVYICYDKATFQAPEDDGMKKSEQPASEEEGA